MAKRTPFQGEKRGSKPRWGTSRVIRLIGAAAYPSASRRTRGHGLAADDVALSRRRRGFNSPWPYSFIGSRPPRRGRPPVKRTALGSIPRLPAIATPWWASRWGCTPRRREPRSCVQATRGCGSSVLPVARFDVRAGWQGTRLQPVDCPVRFRGTSLKRVRCDGRGILLA